MEKLKDPSMLLSIFNTIGLVSLAVFDYKKFLAIEEEIKGLKNDIGNATRSVVQLVPLNKRMDDLVQEVKRIDEELKRASQGGFNNNGNNSQQAINQLRQKVSRFIDEIYMMQEVIDIIIKELAKKDIIIKVEQPQEEVSVFGRRSSAPTRRGGFNRNNGNDRGERSERGDVNRNRRGSRGDDLREDYMDEEYDEVESQINDYRNRSTINRQ